MQSLKEKIGEDVFARIEAGAEKEVALAMKMPLADQWRQKKYYRPRFVLPEFLEEMSHFQKLNFNFSPVDIFVILFRAKILFAVQNEDEFSHRNGQSSISTDVPYFFRWAERGGSIDQVISKHFEQLRQGLIERTLLVEISHFVNNPFNQGEPRLNSFFEELALKIDLRISPFLDEDTLIEKHKSLEPNRRNYVIENAKQYFNAPSIGFSMEGSLYHSYFYASAQLRIFLNLLRIAGFVHAGQIDVGFEVKPIMAPTSPTFLGDRSSGGYVWDEDKKKPWEKIPDGVLFRSFGFRGISNMYLDTRTFGGIEKFFCDNQTIIGAMKNPWDPENLRQIEPVLDILSSATQITDMGAKILLLYCALEHLFVPININSDNKKYVVGGIYAIDSGLLPWFERLYKLRCDYAHKGYVSEPDKALEIVFESMRNICHLLSTKFRKVS